MSPPLLKTATPVLASVRDESTNTEKVLPHADPTFYEVAKRLDWGNADWLLVGPSFEDGSRPKFEIEWRLGELILKILMKYANAKLSRAMRDQLKKGGPIDRVRLVKKLTPAAGTNANQNCNESSNTEIQEDH